MGQLELGESLGGESHSKMSYSRRMALEPAIGHTRKPGAGSLSKIPLSARRACYCLLSDNGLLSVQRSEAHLIVGYPYIMRIKDATAKMLIIPSWCLGWTGIEVSLFS